MRIALIALAGCGVATADPPPLATAQADLATQHAKGCKDTCCLPHADWFGRGRPTTGDLGVARRVLADPDPARIALALRVLAGGVELRDAPAVARLVDDTRAGGELPAVHATQQMQPCYPVGWHAVTVGREALDLLGRLYATQFADAAAYRAWAAAHPDPESTFDYWYTQLSQRRPADVDTLARLKTRDPLLVARVLAAYCEHDDDCGGTAALGKLFATNLGADRALRWLARTEAWNDGAMYDAGVATLLRVGEAIFTDKHVPALQAAAKAFTPHNRGRLAVLASRLRPAEARAMWSAALAAGDAPALVLREAARRDPAGFAATLERWYAGGAAKDAELARAILDGLAESGAAGRATLKRLLAARPFDAGDEDIATSLAAAATAAACPSVPDARSVTPHPGKNASATRAADEDKRARAAREQLAVAVENCR